MDQNTVALQLFNLQRFQILQSKFNQGTHDFVSDAYAYAWYHKIYPALDTCDLHEVNEDYFLITKSQVNLVIKYVNKKWTNRKYLTFHEYEEIFISTEFHAHKLSRDILSYIFRYAYLKKAFDKEFWEGLLSPSCCPKTMKYITSEFELSHITMD